MASVRPPSGVAVGSGPPVGPEAGGATAAAPPVPPRARAALLEDIVAAGLCPKVHAEFIPELMAIVRGLDEVARACQSEPDVVARAWVLLRGVRGLRGVEWTTRFLLDHLSELGAEMDSHFAQILLNGLRAHGDAAHPGNPNWAAHAEGLHRVFSGPHFVEALTTPEGQQAINDIVRGVRPLMCAVLAGTPELPARLESTEVLRIMRIVEGRVVLRARPSLARAAGYNAMDFARSFIAWAVISRRAAEAPMSQEVWLELQRRQGGSHRKRKVAQPCDVTACDYFDVGSAADVERYLLRLQSRAVPLLPLDSAAPITWPTLLVCLCETRQALRDPRIGSEGLEAVLREPREKYAPVAGACLRDFLSAGAAPRGCVMVAVVLAALQHIRSLIPRAGCLSSSSNGLPSVSANVLSTDSQGAALADTAAEGSPPALLEPLEFPADLPPVPVAAVPVDGSAEAEGATPVAEERSARGQLPAPFCSVSEAVAATLAEISSLEGALARARQRLLVLRDAERLQEQRRVVVLLGLDPRLLQ